MHYLILILFLFMPIGIAAASRVVENAKWAQVQEPGDTYEEIQVFWQEKELEQFAKKPEMHS